MILLLLPIAIAAMILTYAASYHVLKPLPAIGRPRPIAAIVALLSGLSLLSLGHGVVALILIPYAALGSSLLFLVLYKWLLRSGAWRNLQRFFEDYDSSPPRRPPPSKRAPSNQSKRVSGHLGGTPTMEE
jgi:hypothetical protein